MARPKTGKPPKRCLNLTVDEKTKMQLDLLSQRRQQSISAMVAEWADRETKELEQENQRNESNKKYFAAIQQSTILPKIVKNHEEDQKQEKE